MRTSPARLICSIVATLTSALLACSAHAKESAEWPVHGGTDLEQRFSPLQQINTDNVSKLGLSWSFEFDSNRGQEATPIVTGGVLYVSTAWSRVYALDAATGRQLWRYDPKIAGRIGFDACCDVVTRGVAVADGRVFLAALDGRLIALEGKTGKPIWSAQTTDAAKPYTITGAPRVMKDKVIIGNAGAEYGVRGYVTAYSTATGKQLWRFYTVPGKRLAQILRASLQKNNDAQQQWGARHMFRPSKLRTHLLQAQEAGYSPQEILDGSGIGWSDIESLQPLDLDTIAGLFDYLARRTPPDFAVRAGHTSKVRNYGIVGFATMSMPTLRDAFEHWSRYYLVSGDPIITSISEHDDEWRMHFEPRCRMSQAAQRFCIETSVAALEPVIEELTDSPP